MALAGDARIVIGGRAGTISEVCLAWLHKRPLLPLTGCGGWPDDLLAHPPDERRELAHSSVELGGRARGAACVSSSSSALELDHHMPNETV